MKQLIKKGKHRSWPMWLRLNLRDFTVRVTLDKSMFFIEQENVSITAWNKLVGVSGLLNHKNSTRIAWRPGLFDWEIELAIYEYVDGKRDIIPIGVVSFADKLEFDFNKKSLVMRVNGVETVLIAGQRVRRMFMQNFYFGGKSVSPHKMWIDIRANKA